MPTRNVFLTDHQTQLVDRLVASGRYQDAGEVFREGLRLIEHQDAEERIRLDALREAVRIGAADIDEGRYRSFSSADTLDYHLASLAGEAIGEDSGDPRRR